MDPSQIISDVPSSTFSARSSSIDLAPPKLYTSDEIGLYDVLCGRDKAAFNNIGNRRFRVTVSLSLERYLQAATRKDKSVVIKSVVTMLHADGGKFLQLVSTSTKHHNGSHDGPLYVELNEKQAHEKAGHALRDMALLRNKSSSSTLSKKHKAVEPPMTMDIAMSTTTPATSIASSLVTSNKRVKRSQQAHLESTNIGQDPNEHLLPRQLDSWTELTWDESSELTHDESIFDNLVQSVVVNNSAALPMPDDTMNPTGMMIVHDSMDEEQPSVVIFPLHSHEEVMVNDERMDVDRISNTVSEMMNNKAAPQGTERTSSTSFTLDDEMVSWLVGESDFVMQI